MFSEEICYCRHDCCFPDGQFFDCDICECHVPIEDDEDGFLTADDIFGD